jgi:hypothetical protein
MFRDYKYRKNSQNVDTIKETEPEPVFRKKHSPQ